MATYETILVPTDGSERADEAVEVAFRVAKEYGADVHALFVVDTSIYGEPALSSVEMFLDDLAGAGDDLLHELVGRGTEHGLNVERAVRHGDPHEAILAYADEVDADLIVMGYQGHSHRAHRGSVVDRVLAGTDRHVLVI